MIKLTVLLMITTSILLTSCSESRTYSGVLKRLDATKAEGKVTITFTKQSETEATMVIKSDGEPDPGILTHCVYPIKLQLLQNGSVSKSGKGYWSPDYCVLKGEFGERSASLVANADDFVVEKEGMKWKMRADADGSETRFEFMSSSK